MFNEHHFLTSGSKKSTVYELDEIEMGTIICYDLRFPELTRSLALEDAKVILFRHNGRNQELIIESIITC